MAGTRLLVTLSFAIPFITLVFVALNTGIPHDDLLWKRLVYTLSEMVLAETPPVLLPNKQQVELADGQSGWKPTLLVPPSWKPNEVETVLYEVVPTEGISSLCGNQQVKNAQSDLVSYSDAMVLCPGRSSHASIRNDKTIFIHSSSVAEFRRVILTDEEPFDIITPHVRLLFDQTMSSENQWKALVDDVMKWTAHWKKRHHVCIDDTITIELDVVDPNDMKKSIGKHTEGTGIIILYLTSEARAEEMRQKMGGMNYNWNGAFVYLETNVSTAIDKLQDGLQRIILHECWNLPHSIVFESLDTNGLETLNHIYNATFSKRLAQQIRRDAAMLQHRVDHFHFSVEKAESIARSLQLLARRNWGQAKRALDSVRFRMSPDFPWDQYAAIFAPLLFPLLLPITFTTVREWKRYNKQRSSSVTK